MFEKDKELTFTNSLLNLNIIIMKDCIIEISYPRLLGEVDLHILGHLTSSCQTLYPLHIYATILAASLSPPQSKKRGRLWWASLVWGSFIIWPSCFVALLVGVQLCSK